MEFLKGMRTDSRGIVLYYSLYLLRRSVLIVTLVILHEYTALTMLIFIILTLLTMVSHVVMEQQFVSDRANILDRACETVIYLACLIQIAQLSYFEIASATAVIDASRALTIFGYVNLGLVGFFSLLVTLMILGTTLRKVLKIFYSWIKHRLALRRKK